MLHGSCSRRQKKQQRKPLLKKKGKNRKRKPRKPLLRKKGKKRKPLLLL